MNGRCFWQRGGCPTEQTQTAAPVARSLKEAGLLNEKNQRPNQEGNEFLSQALTLSPETQVGMRRRGSFAMWEDEYLYQASSVSRIVLSIHKVLKYLLNKQQPSSTNQRFILQIFIKSIYVLALSENHSWAPTKEWIILVGGTGWRLAVYIWSSALPPTYLFCASFSKLAKWQRRHKTAPT